MKRKAEARPTEFKKAVKLEPMAKAILDFITHYYSLNFNVSGSENNGNFLIAAMDEGLPHVAAYALERDADPHTAISSATDEDNDGRAPLSEAVWHAMIAASEREEKLANGYVELVHQLLKKGADPNYLPEGSGARYPINALFYYYDSEQPLCQQVGVQLVSLLREYGADFSLLTEKFQEKYKLLTRIQSSPESLSATGEVRLPGLGGVSHASSTNHSSDLTPPLIAGQKP